MSKHFGFYCFTANFFTASTEGYQFIGALSSAGCSYFVFLSCCCYGMSNLFDFFGVAISTITGKCHYAIFCAGGILGYFRGVGMTGCRSYVALEAISTYCTCVGCVTFFSTGGISYYCSVSMFSNRSCNCFAADYFVTDCTTYNLVIRTFLSAGCIYYIFNRFAACDMAGCRDNNLFNFNCFVTCCTVGYVVVRTVNGAGCIYNVFCFYDASYVASCRNSCCYSAGLFTTYGAVGYCIVGTICCTGGSSGVFNLGCARSVALSRNRYCEAVIASITSKCSYAFYSTGGFFGYCI